MDSFSDIIRFTPMSQSWRKYLLLFISAFAKYNKFLKVNIVHSVFCGDEKYDSGFIVNKICYTRLRRT